jgi:carbonic anhydrase/acetyltransferase-like protein (isoleucine patch superfamily)
VDHFVHYHGSIMAAPLFHRHGELFLAHNATVTGDVRCGTGVNLWFNVVVRGDVAPITLGDFVNIQDGAIVHCDFDAPLVIETGVVAGHAAILHGVRIGADTLVGMGATLLSGTDIGPECVIAAGSVVPPGMVVPLRSLVMGIPGKIVRRVTDEEVERTRAINRRYRELSRQHAEGQYAIAR